MIRCTIFQAVWLAFGWFIIIPFAATGSTNSAEYENIASDSLKRQTKYRDKKPEDSTGYQVEINRIFILGNKRTRESIILRELTLQTGDTIYSSKLGEVLEKDQQKIFNLHLFNAVDIRPVELTPGKIDILIEVDERWYTFPVPIFQLSDRNFNEWWETYNHDLSRVIYGIKLYQYNMRGRNETLTLTAQFGFIRRFDLMYRFPYIDKKQKQGLIFSMDFIDAKNVAYQTSNHKLDFLETDMTLRNTRGIGLTYTYRNSFYRHHRIGYNVRETNISDSLLNSNPLYLGLEKKEQQLDILSYEFISDYRDVVAYPLKGQHFLAHIQKTGMFLNKDLNMVESWVSFSDYRKLKNNFFLSNLSYGYWSSKTDIPYYNFGAMGYRRIFVRGYEIFVVEGPWYVLNKTTLKKRIFSRTYQLDGSTFRQFKYLPLAIYLKTYADFGYVQNYPRYEESIPPVNTSLSDKIMAGTGLGLDIVSSYDIVIRFEYSFTAEGTSGFFFHLKKEF